MSSNNSNFCDLTSEPESDDDEVVEVSGPALVPRVAISSPSSVNPTPVQQQQTNNNTAHNRTSNNSTSDRIIEISESSDSG